MSRDGEVKMTDFGIAKVVGSATITLSGENVLGSVHYIAPEQAQGEEIDERTDIYSLGISLYEMLTGRVPFEADTTVSVALKHIQEEMVPPDRINREVSYSLSACTLKACAKDPAMRYQSPHALAEDLQRCLMLPEGHFADLPIKNSRPGVSVGFSRAEAFRTQKSEAHYRSHRACGVCCNVRVDHCILDCTSHDEQRGGDA